MTGGSPAVSALAPMEDTTMMAKTAAAANGGTNDRMTALEIWECWAAM
jgi:hypothetical protein